MKQDLLNTFGTIIGATLLLCGQELIKWIKARRKLSHAAENMIKTLDSSSRIQDCLDELRHIVQCDRIHVMEYSNGNTSLVGNSFKNYSIRYESVNPIYAPVMKDYQNVPVGQYSELLKDIQRFGYKYIGFDDDSAIGRLHRTYGIKSSYKFRIGDHIVNGSVSLAWHNEDYKMTPKQISIVKDYIVKIHNLMTLK